MTIFRKISLFFLWLFYGYFGHQQQGTESLQNRIWRFSCRLFLFYLMTMFVWNYFHLYYESLLWFVLLKIGYIVSSLPLGTPELNSQNKLCCSIGNLIFFPNMGWFTGSTLSAIPLLMSSSGISFFKRAKILFNATVVLFLFQIFCGFLGMYGWLYSNYSMWFSDKSIRVYEILVYDQSNAEIIFALNHFFKVFLRHAVSVGVWIGLTCFIKKTSDQNFFEKLF